MVPGVGMETSLIETTYELLKLLLMLVFYAIMAGILTLPLFYGALAYMIAWFWSADVTSGSLFRRIVAKVIRFGFPAFSAFATLMSLGYFGAFDWPYRLATDLSPRKLGPTQQVVKEKFDAFTRVVAGRQ